MSSKRKPKRHLKSQVKKRKVQNSQNFTMETILDRFPTLSDNIFESLDEKSLANCVEVNRKWQATLNFLSFSNPVIQIILSRGENMSSKRKPKRHLKSQVKKRKVQNSQNFTMETILDRFPTLSDNIFESLDEKSLANCVEVNRKWQSTLANKKVSGCLLLILSSG